MKADLHLHTHYSDGTDSPERVIQRASEAGLDLVAITDHDTMGGVGEAMEAGKRCKVRVIPGVEITANWNHHELHLLAYFFPKQGRSGKSSPYWESPIFLGKLEGFARDRLERAEKIVGRLNHLGISLTLDAVRQQAGKGTVGRPHIAKALVEGNFVSSMERAFDEFLKRGRPGWVDKPRIETREAISLVHDAHGLVVLAHPGLLHDQSILPQLLDLGLDGLEAFHSRHTSSQSLRYRQMVQARHLLETGGSDCHGQLKGEPLMGRAFLEGEALDVFIERLQSASMEKPVAATR